MVVPEALTLKAMVRFHQSHPFSVGDWDIGCPRLSESREAGSIPASPATFTHDASLHGHPAAT